MYKKRTFLADERQISVPENEWEERLGYEAGRALKGSRCRLAQAQSDTWASWNGEGWQSREEPAPAGGGERRSDEHVDSVQAPLWSTAWTAEAKHGPRCAATCSHPDDGRGALWFDIQQETYATELFCYYLNDRIGIGADVEEESNDFRGWELGKSRWSCDYGWSCPACRLSEAGCSRSGCGRWAQWDKGEFVYFGGILFIFFTIWATFPYRVETWNQLNPDESTINQDGQSFAIANGETGKKWRKEEGKKEEGRRDLLVDAIGRWASARSILLPEQLSIHNLK